jgi:hypothetical protein
MENVEIKNQKNGAKSMLFWGLSNNMTSAMTARDFVVIDCVSTTLMLNGKPSLLKTASMSR